MSFFQNVFDSEFRANLFSADRKLQSSYKITANTNRSDYLVCSEGPYDLTGNTDLTINYAYDPALIGYASLTVNISGLLVSNTQPYEIVTILNSNPTFADIFSATVSSNRVLIISKKNRALFKAYISNTSAESILGFNSKAPVAELPSYFERYSFENRFDYKDLGSHRLVLLNPSNPIDAAIISNAGLDPLNSTPDWKLLKGSNDAFWFYKRTYTTGQLTSEIKYPAGASEGDLAKKTYYVYDGSDLINVMETPYILQSGDLMAPP